MNVLEEMKRIYGNRVYYAARRVNEVEADRLEHDFQKAWDDGKGFSLQSMFGHRVDDDSEGKIACGQLYNALKEVVKKDWLSKFSREEIVSLCNLLAKGPDSLDTKINLIGDLSMSVLDIVQDWNKSHSEEEPIRFNFDPFPA